MNIFPLKQLGNVENIWSSMIIDTLKVAGPRDNLHGLYCAADKVPSRLQLRNAFYALVSGGRIRPSLAKSYSWNT